MWWCQVISRISKCIRVTSALALAVAIAQSNSTISYAQHPAVAGEYVITPRLVAADALTTLKSGALRDASAEPIRSLGRSVLVRDTAPRVAADVDVGSKSTIDGDDFCIRMIKTGLVRDCSPNYILSAGAVPNDPQFANLWGLSVGQGINAPGAWDLTTGNSTTVVAVIDTGADLTHPDLVGNLWNNSGEIPGNGLDDDNNGYIDDIHGINAITGSGNPNDDNGHGSHCVGTVGARGNNALGVSGVNWNVQLMPLKFLDANGMGSLSNAIVAIDYIVTMKNRGVNIRVSSNSWGGGGYSQAMYDAIARARDAGIIFVAAAGNESNDNDASPSYPGGYELSNVVSVAAIDKLGSLASFSNFGATTVDIGAPGVGILSTYKNGGYATLSGTSMATPHVAGALALLLDHIPSITNDQAIQRLYETAAAAPGLDGATKYARKLEVSRLLTGESSPLPVEPAVPSCSYVASEIAFAPDRSADGLAPVQQADEGNYATVSLPFTFPFYGRDISKLILSPNGVIYTKQAPSGMDYQNASRAPLNSVAALHSDLVGTTNPLGVRYASGSSSATVYYRARHYGFSGAGEAQAWVTFYSNGTIEEHLEFSNASIAEYIRSKATVGIAGSVATAATTVGYNSPTIRNGLAVRYTPICDGVSNTPIVKVNAVAIKGVDSAGKAYRYAARGRALQVVLQGTGTGTVQLQPVLDGVKCSNSVSATLYDGAATLSGSVPRMVRRSLALRVTTVQAHGKIGGKIAVRDRFKAGSSQSNKNSRRASVRQLKRACSTLMSRLVTAG